MLPLGLTYLQRGRPGHAVAFPFWTGTLTGPSHAVPGLELSFYSGVYGTCLGATAHFGNAAKGLIGLSGIVVGFGEILGKFGVFGPPARELNPNDCTAYTTE